MVLGREQVVDGLSFVSSGKRLDVPLPILNRFRCLSPGGLHIVYEGGAVLRSDIEVFDGSANLGTIPVSTTIPMADALVLRFLNFPLADAISVLAGSSLILQMKAGRRMPLSNDSAQVPSLVAEDNISYLLFPMR
jgi:hypothetical protein